MRQVAVRELKPGMVTGADVITKRGQVIAEKGTALSAQLIARLSFYRIEAVTIDEPEPQPQVREQPSPAPAPAVSPEQMSVDRDEVLDALNKALGEPRDAMFPKMPEPIFSETEPPASAAPEPKKEENTYISESMGTSNALSMDSEYQSLQITYARVLASLRNNFNAMLDGDFSGISMDEMLNDSKELFQSRTAVELFDLLRGLRSNDDVIYAHCLNVAMVSRAIGKWLKFSREDLDILTLAGLLHDIGKMLIPMDILTKSGKLTDDEFAKIRQHPTDGYKILKKIPGLDPRILYTALQHHERFDGSGYPRHLPGDEIDDFAAIIAIADVYDAMTAIRAYRAPKCAFEVIEDFEKDGLQKYNPKYILTFLKHIASYYQNSKVILSDGEKVDIIYINSASLSRPIVRYADGHVVDLSQNRQLKIVSTM